MVMDGKPGMKSKTQVEGGGCTHCGNMKHTKETCFKLHGYPDWWHELKTKKKRESGRVLEIMFRTAELEFYSFFNF
jgi:hypothetical protein